MHKFNSKWIFDFIFRLAEFIELCPEGKGFIPSEEPHYGDVAHSYKGQP